MNLIKLSLLLGLSVGVIHTSTMTTSMAAQPKSKPAPHPLSNWAPPLSPAANTNFTTRLAYMMHPENPYSYDGLDIIALLLGRTMSDGTKPKVEQNLKPTNTDKKLIVKAMHKVMTEFKGNFLWDKFVLDDREKTTNPTNFFHQHALRVYALGSYFQNMITETDKSLHTIIPKIADKVPDNFKQSFTEDHIDKFLRGIGATNPQVSFDENELYPGSPKETYSLATNIAKGSKTVVLLNHKPQMKVLHESLKEIKGVKMVDFDTENEVAGFAPVPQDNIPFYVVPTDSQNNSEEFMIDKYEKKGNITDTFVITDNQKKRYLVAHVDPLINSGIDMDDQPNLNRRRNLITLSSGKVSPDAEKKMTELSDFLEGTSGVPYDFNTLRRLDSDNKTALPNDVIQHLRPRYQQIMRKKLKDESFILPQTYKFNHENAFKIMAMSKQGFSGEPPLILKDVDFPGHANYKKRLGFIHTQNNPFMNVAVTTPGKLTKDELRANINAALRQNNIPEQTDDQIAGILKNSQINCYPVSLFVDYGNHGTVQARIDDKSKVVNIESFASPTGFARFVKNNSDQKNEYYLLDIDDNSGGFEGLFQEKTKGVLYKQFYTSKILYRLNKNDWKIYQESQGIPG
ncbi:MAG: hypothetical protein K2X98_03665, partial [Alphaproteobacteria bacterium]|nr:hypothetical protein [Alphaproteobacteria bacterium]